MFAPQEPPAPEDSQSKKNKDFLNQIIPSITPSGIPYERMPNSELIEAESARELLYEVFSRTRPKGELEGHMPVDFYIVHKGNHRGIAGSHLKMLADWEGEEKPTEGCIDALLEGGLIKPYIPGQRGHYIAVDDVAEGTYLAVLSRIQ